MESENKDVYVEKPVPFRSVHRIFHEKYSGIEIGSPLRKVGDQQTEVFLLSN